MQAATLGSIREVVVYLKSRGVFFSHPDSPGRGTVKKFKHLPPHPSLTFSKFRRLL
jgi:hypothetical protein